MQMDTKRAIAILKLETQDATLDELIEAYQLMQDEIARLFREEERRIEEQKRYESAISQGKAQLASIREMVEALRAAHGEDDNETLSIEEAERAIDEDALSVETRDGWTTAGGKGDGAEEYRILLCTGGPACQIWGELDDYNMPNERIELQVQDWFLPWKAIPLEPEDREILREYARQFYFGE
jgi:hypothetical protein